jgi:hypothetical protein
MGMTQHPISILSTLRIINCKAIMNEKSLKCTHKFMVFGIFFFKNSRKNRDEEHKPEKYIFWD